MPPKKRPGEVRNAIVDFLKTKRGADAHIREIHQGVEERIGEVPSSSVRSYLNQDKSNMFERTGRGRYRLRK